MGNIFWYELCFYGDEDTSEDNPKYNPELACSYVIKTEIPNITDEVAIKILTVNMDEDEAAELRDNLTKVMLVDEEEASSFDVEDLTNRVETEDGVIYTRQ